MNMYKEAVVIRNKNAYKLMDQLMGIYWILNL